MKTKSSILLSLAMLSVLLISPRALSSVRLSAVGEYVLPTLSSNSAQLPPSLNNSSGRWSWGGGLMLGVPIYEEEVFIQAGALYVPRTVSDGQTTTTFNFVEIPLQFRIWLTQHIVFGVGGYYAQGIGSASVSGPSGSSAPAFSSLGVSNTDFGLLTTLGFQLHLFDGVAFFVDGLYEYGLKDADSTPPTPGSAKWSEVAVLSGLRFAL